MLRNSKKVYREKAVVSRLRVLQRQFSSLIFYLGVPIFSCVEKTLGTCTVYSSLGTFLLFAKLMKICSIVACFTEYWARNSFCWFLSNSPKSLEIMRPSGSLYL